MGISRYRYPFNCGADQVVPGAAPRTTVTAAVWYARMLGMPNLPPSKGQSSSGQTAKRAKSPMMGMTLDERDAYRAKRDSELYGFSRGPLVSTNPHVSAPPEEPHNPGAEARWHRHNENPNEGEKLVDRLIDQHLHDFNATHMSDEEYEQAYPTPGSSMVADQARADPRRF